MNVMLTGFDYVLLAMLTISALVGVIRGLIRELLALLAWIVSLWVALTYADTVAAWLAPYLQSSEIQYMVALAGVFVVCLLGLSMIAMIVVKLLDLVGVTGTDRTLGGLFGLARGLAIALMVVFVIRLTPAISQPWFARSLLVPYFDPVYEFLDNQDYIQPLKKLPEQALPGAG